MSIFPKKCLTKAVDYSNFMRIGRYEITAERRFSRAAKVYRNVKRGGDEKKLTKPSRAAGRLTR